MLDLYLAEGVTPIEGERFAADWEEQGIEVVRLPYEEALRRPPARPGTPRPRSRSASTGSSRPGGGRPTRRTGPAGRPGPPGGPPA